MLIFCHITEVFSCMSEIIRYVYSSKDSLLHKICAACFIQSCFKLTSKNPCINKATGTLNTLVPGLNILQQLSHLSLIYEPRHEISNKVGCATSKALDQSAHTHSLIRSLSLHLLEITCRGSYMTGSGTGIFMKTSNHLLTMKQQQIIKP